jgi:hypothetical protein
VEILANGWTSTADFWDVYEETLCLIQNKLKEEEIGFAVPKHEVLLASSSDSA